MGRFSSDFSHGDADDTVTYLAAKVSVKDRGEHGRVFVTRRRLPSQWPAVEHTTEKSTWASEQEQMIAQSYKDYRRGVRMIEIDV